MTNTKKTTSTKAILLALVIVLGVIVSPVSAITTWEQLDAILNSHRETVNNVYDFTYDGSTDGDAIYKVDFTVPRDAYVNFTLYYGTSSSVTGSAQSTPTGGINPLITTTAVELNGVSKYYTFWDVDPVYDYDIAGYASNGTDMVGFAVYSKDYNSAILGNDLIVGYLVPDITHNLIYKIHFSGNKPFSVTYTSAPNKNIVDRIVTGTETGLLNEFKKITDLAWAIWSTLFLVVTETFYWLKFFFWDNLVLTIALYIALTGAVAMNQSKDIWAALKKFFQYQRGIFNFIISMWNSLLDIVSKFRSIFGL
jgi:hypothetical protein